MARNHVRPNVAFDARPVRRIPLKPHEWLSEITPEPDVFVLSHMGTPQVDAAAWSLEIAGLVKRPRRFTLANIFAMPRREVRSFHQCAGYPRDPTLPTRRLANVVWGGVDLSTLLAEAEVAPSARYLWSYGLDHGSYDGFAAESYVKDMPLSRLAAGGVLLAYELDGQPLSRDHGFPLRLFIPGYYGTNSVKWLYRLELADRRADGPFTTALYNDTVAATPEWPDGRKPVWDIAPESAIVAPAPETLLRGGPVEIWGRAWGASGIAAVEVSTDGGAHWHRAALGPRTEWSWQRFTFAWSPAKAGPAALMSRAIDSRGTVQPFARARNAILSVPVTVESTAAASP